MYNCVKRCFSGASDLILETTMGGMIIKPFRKSISSNTLFHARSSHPEHVILEVPVGQFIRKELLYYVKFKLQLKKKGYSLVTR